VLIAPLDWGLGHTTRCIPIIKELRKKNFRVIVACNERQSSFLKDEISDLDTVFLRGYDIRYSSNKIRTTLKIIHQIPKILIAVKREIGDLRRFINEFQPELIISDNRYGFYSPRVYSIIITHQLSLQTGLGNLLNLLLSRILRRQLRHFQEIWVPDNKVSPQLAGSLAAPPSGKLPPTIYMGAYSRLEACETVTGNLILVVLSGPEPQRTILENRIIESAGRINNPIILIRGTSIPCASLPPNTRAHDFANTTLLNELLCKASVVISRSGYTSVMDMLKLKKRWIVIPTPGQGEQEYLADYLQQNLWAMAVSQKDFDLAKALDKATTFAFQHPEWDAEKYKEVIAGILSC